MNSSSATAGGMVRRVLVRSLSDVTVEYVHAPVPCPGEVVVSSSVAGICGSDVHAAAGRHPFISLPFHPGHEVVGVVKEVGRDVDPNWVGKRVVIEPNLACGRCEQCQEGRYNICQTLDVFGCQTPGGMADAFSIGVDRIHEVPGGMSDSQAALVEPLATPVHAVRRAGDLRGSRVAILGGGPIGLFVLLAAIRAGAGSVVVGDPLKTKRARAERIGAAGSFDVAAADGVTDAVKLLEGPAHVVFDCVSRESSVRQAVELVGKGGKIMVVGVASGPTPVPLHLIQDRELSLIGNLMYVQEDFKTAIDMLAQGDIPLEEFITGTFPLEAAAEAFAASADPEHVKILLTISGLGQ